MKTTPEHGSARIVDVTPKRVRAAIDQGSVAIVAGFQGFNQVTGDITTLGRGGSDTTAVALAAALDAEVCEIYTDVDGVFTTDPRVVPLARKIDSITSEEMLELASSGAKVLHLRAVEYARRHGVALHVRSSFSNEQGTIVFDPLKGHPKGEQVEEPIITGIAFEKDEAKVTVTGVPDVPGKAAQIFEIVAKSDANIDMIVQNVSADNRTDISFTVPMSDGRKVVDALEREHESIAYQNLVYDDQIAKIAVVGAGMRNATGVSAQLFRALFDAGINIEMISTSEIRVSVVTRADVLEKAVRALHTAFDLDADTEAVVYAGTGR